MKPIEAGLQHLREIMQDRLVEVSTLNDSPGVEIMPEGIIDAVRALKDGPGVYNLLVAQTAVDYWPESPRFKVVYEFLSTEHPDILRIEVFLADGQALDSIVDVFPNANWHEREVWDMFGIHFNGHPDQRRILMPQDWVGHPLRKDYPLGYEEVQFSFNYDEIDQRKRYAKD